MSRDSIENLSELHEIGGGEETTTCRLLLLLLVMLLLLLLLLLDDCGEKRFSSFGSCLAITSCCSLKSVPQIA